MTFPAFTPLPIPAAPAAPSDESVAAGEGEEETPTGVVEEESAEARNRAKLIEIARGLAAATGTVGEDDPWEDLYDTATTEDLEKCIQTRTDRAKAQNIAMQMQNQPSHAHHANPTVAVPQPATSQQVTTPLVSCALDCVSMR